MKRIGFVLSLVAISATAMAQGSKVTSASTSIKYGQLDKAKEAIEEALLNEKTKDQAKTWMVRGDVYKAIAETPNPAMKGLCETPTTIALQSYKKAMELDVKGSLRKQILNTLKFMSLSQTFLKAAYDFYEKEDFVNCLDCFEQSLSVDTLIGSTAIDTATIFNAGIVAEKIKNYNKAIYYYNKSIDLRYNGASVFVNLANIYKTQGDTVGYLAQLERGMKLFPEESNPLLVELINHYIGLNQSEKALDYLQKAIEKEGNNPSFYFAQGSLLDKLEKQAEAKVSYEKALEIDPNYFDAWLNLGVQVFNKAVEMSKAANDIPANKPKEYDAAIAAAFEQMNLAVPYFEKAYSIKSTDVYVMQVLKECYFKLRGTHPEYNDKYNDIKAKLDAAPQE